MINQVIDIATKTSIMINAQG